MSVPPPLLRSYEAGRLRDAALAAVPVTVLPLAVAVAIGGRAPALLLGSALVLGFFLARWRGRSWARGARVGVLAGTLAAAVPLTLTALGLGCGPGGCASWCMPLCGSIGAFAGTAIGLSSRDARAWSVGAGLAAVAVALGCWPMGLTMVGGAGGALAAAAVAGGLARRVGAAP